MAQISEARVAGLLAPYLQGSSGESLGLPEGLFEKLGLYLDLLLRWNARTNLTAVREPEEIVTRHFGESLFAGRCLGEFVKAGAEVLDLGSGAGFPGLPIQLLLPELKVTLAESQGKKAAFLREAVRVLGLGCEVWAGRVEEMPGYRQFHAVTLRAVDRMGLMTEVGRAKVRHGGVLLEMVGPEQDGTGREAPGVIVRRMPGRVDSLVVMTPVPGGVAESGFVES